MMALALFNDAKAEHDALKPDDDQARAAFHTKWAKNAHDFAVDHGGVYVKAAQFIASLQGGAGEAGVPIAYVDALRPLTDRVPPRPFAAVSVVAEEELGAPIGELVESIEEEPIAAASLAQVHLAHVPPRNASGGAAVAVAFKLQYPTLREQVATDFEVLNMMQSMVTTQYDFTWLLSDLKAYVTSELDFTTEAKNGLAAAAALASLAPAVLIPALVPQLCSTRTLATEYVDGLTRLDRPAELAALRLDPEELGRLVSAAFAELSLIHGLVHGDPHSGNVYARVRPNGTSGAAAGGGGGGGGGSGGGTAATAPAQLVLLDHGLYHRLTDADRLRMCSLILECATPWPSPKRVRACAGHFAGKLAPLFPALLSPAFALAGGLNARQLRAAAEGRLPEGTSLEDVWSTLQEMHSGESDVIGLLHSMGYVRGLHNALAFAEEPRVAALARAAVRALHAAKAPYVLGDLRLRVALALTALRVRVLFVLLYVAAALLRRFDGGATARVAPDA